MGHELLLTARDNAQTVELAREHWPAVAVVGGPSPRGRLAKARALGGRVAALARWGRRQRPDLALSHNSYAQIVAARSVGVPVLTAMDYEHQPANHVAFRLADRILLPEALAGDEVRRQGAKAAKVRWYAGLKEQLYLGDFEPDAGVLNRVGVERGTGMVVAVARTPPTGAAYHRFENPLFEDGLRALGARPEVVCVVLTRRAEQRAAVEDLGLKRCVVPEGAVDSRSLMYAADLVIGAGGTMTREAALLGVPTFSVFAGRGAAVDRWLEENGMLTRLKDAEQLAAVGPRPAEPVSLSALRERGRELVEVFAGAAVEVAGGAT
jgi:predicted glycosyltransferase